jgi:hypothetical protein
MSNGFGQNRLKNYPFYQKGTFLRGVGSVVDFFGDLFPFDYKETNPVKTDEEALAADVKAIAGDFDFALKEIREDLTDEQKKELLDTNSVPRADNSQQMSLLDE